MHLGHEGVSPGRQIEACRIAKPPSIKYSIKYGEIEDGRDNPIQRFASNREHLPTPPDLQRIRGRKAHQRDIMQERQLQVPNIRAQAEAKKPLPRAEIISNRRKR
ncbi:hypothetical protein Nepgr_029706 [Nepenthes gracilis]|uniref:Uncharacterized protein n=1 Tax=Nepenthes gracilis TaxID=150966 RepID=A0AAD3TET4_NEPGR|nr:hypothetical protein Nepgr_029706 [Nepenthes gracilis]